MILEFVADKEARRLDVFLSEKLPNLSRNVLKSLIEKNHVTLNGRIVKVAQKVEIGDRVRVRVEEESSTDDPQPENIQLNIVYEDEDLIVINKSRDMVIHPAPGNETGTLVNALLFHTKGKLSQLGSCRPGIIHRIDKDTTGLLVVAKNDDIHAVMKELFLKREVERIYRAFVWGKPKTETGVIEAPIGRSSYDRKKMAVVGSGRKARTYFKVKDTFPKASELELKLDTGRTHQIRVHMRFINTPVIGDSVYSGKRPTLGLEGQALHAEKLAFRDPRDGTVREFIAPLPDDLLLLKKKLRVMV